MWVSNKILQGHWIYPDGLYFDCKFVNNKPAGKGTWYFKDGRTLVGEFNNKPKDAQAKEEADIKQLANDSLTFRPLNERESCDVQIFDNNAIVRQSKDLSAPESKGEIIMHVEG